MLCDFGRKRIIVSPSGQAYVASDAERPLGAPGIGFNQSDQQVTINLCRKLHSARSRLEYLSGGSGDIAMHSCDIDTRLAPAGFPQRSVEHPNDTHDTSVFGTDCGRTGNGVCSGARTCAERSPVRGVGITASRLGL